jgi:cytochrome c551/c552
VTTRGPLGALLLAATLTGTVLATAARGAEPPGDAGRGAAVFTAKGCGRCHLPGDRGPGMGPVLGEVRRPQGTLELAGRLWNHAPAMFAAFANQGLPWPGMTREEMADLGAYLQADRTRDPAPDLFRGRAVLVRKGCLKCHRLQGEGGSAAIELAADHDRYDSPVTWATTVWNHAPRMAAAAARLDVLYPRFSGEEMAYLFHFLQSAAGK